MSSLPIRPLFRFSLASARASAPASHPRMTLAGASTLGLMALALGLGVLGGLDLDPIRQSVQTDRHRRLWARFERFGQRDRESHLELRIDPSLVQGDRVRFWIDAPLLAGIRLERMTPGPERARLGPNWLEFVLAAPADPGQPLALRIDYQPRQAGRLAGHIGHDAGPVLSVEQWIRP